MASLKVALQKQNEYEDGYPLIVRAFIGKRTIQFSMNVRLHPNQLRNDGKVIKHPDALEINKAVSDSMRIIEDVFTELGDRLPRLTTAEIKMAVYKKCNPDESSSQQKKFDVFDCFDELMKTKTKSKTYDSYVYAKKIIREYCDSILIDYPTFDSVTHAWLLAFQGWLNQKYKHNTVFAIIKCLKAVFNYALANEYTTKYPFRKFSCVPQKDSPTEPLTSEQIKMIRDLEIAHKQQSITRDVFMLTFYLAGINPVDMYNLKYDDTYVKYKRQKTGSNIKFLIPDEVRPYIEKYKDAKGEKMFDFKMSETEFKHNLNYHLKNIGSAIGRTPESMYMYVARHSFATIAMQECDMSYSEVGQMLGHEEHTVTSRYAKPSENKLNANIRRVLDTLLSK